ncbi:MAG: hemolysin [Ignavibacteriae bacterium]|nr:MAG: hemolysin [Ignavibacteriota bacterium]
MFLLIIYASVSIFFSFLCSILEAVLLSITPTFLNIKKQEKKSFAFTLEKLKADIDKPLITILTINTIAHTVGAILVGVQSEQAFGSGNNMIGIVSAIMTLLILILSEIIPKTIGATYWKQLANFTSKTLIIMMFPLKWTGILWLLQITTKLIGKASHGSALSRSEFSAMAEAARKTGVFDETEFNFIKNLVNFKQVLAKDIMTPRTVIKLGSSDTSIQEFYDKNKDLLFSRIPIYEGSTDNITGYVLKDEILKKIADNENHLTLKDIKRNIIIKNRETPIPFLLEEFITKKEHIALVVDEFGSVAGLITMEDVIETLLGLEIIDESDKNHDMQHLARTIWEERAKKYGLLKNNENNEGE